MTSFTVNGKPAQTQEPGDTGVKFGCDGAACDAYARIRAAIHKATEILENKA